MKYGFSEGIDVVRSSDSIEGPHLIPQWVSPALLLVPVLFSLGMLALLAVSVLGWFYGVRQNGVISGFPERT